MTEMRITASEFRKNQKHFFDLADKGARITIYRRNRPDYTLAPTSKIDPFFTPEMLAEIDQAMAEVKAGKGKVYDKKLDEELFGDIL